MPTIKFDYTGACRPGGEHSYIDVLVDGVKRKTMILNTQDMIDPKPITAEQFEAWAETLLIFHRRRWLKQNPSGTNAQYIAALEAEEWVI